MRKISIISNHFPYLTNNVSIPVFSALHKSILQFVAAILAFIFVFFLNTSYLHDRPDINNLQLEYFTPGAVDSLRMILSSDATNNLVDIEGEKLFTYENVKIFYARNGYKPVWTHFNGLNVSAKSLLFLIENARDYGLEPDHYHLSAIRETIQKFEDRNWRKKDSELGTNLELIMTDAAFTLMVNLHAGYQPFDSTLVTQQWYYTLPALLQQGISNHRIIENILSVQPAFIDYVLLQQATEKFIRANSLTDQWVTITYPTKDTLTLDKQVKEVLITLGYFVKDDRDADFITALKKFQHYHGLEPDGKTGKNTIEALRQSTLYKYRTLALNLDRFRKQQNLDSNMLYVNIPAYYLKIFNENRLKDTFRIIVGHPSSPTPILTGKLEKIITNPMWYVPRRITMHEILPKIKSDSGYLKRNGFKILDKNFNTVDHKSLNFAEISENNFDYTLRQNRGSDNSLGRVKFMFSNPYSVYLHDTPGKRLFLKDQRAFSHGCVRVQNPEKLASYIVNELNSDNTDITQLITAGTHREIDMAINLPVHITYITCEADESGNLYFYKDIYGIDKKEMEKFVQLTGI
jgi:murein L,D-transpeptidase YcbB/YkuD